MRKTINKIRRLINRIALIIVGIISLVVLIHVVSMLTFDKWIEYKEVSFQSTKIPVEMNGYKIAFISDTHALVAQELKSVVEEVNKIKTDLLLLGGDFPSRGGAPERSMEILSQIKTSDGIFGVEGNHDNYIDLFAAMEQHSIKPLSNNGIHIREQFYLAGVEDFWNRNPDIEKAVEGADPNDFIILLAHNPDITMAQNTEKIDLILSGHTHGGQITLFGIFAPALALSGTVTDYGQRFMSGWAESLDGVPVYVSKGMGVLSYSQFPRVFARPQVIIITLLSEE